MNTTCLLSLLSLVFFSVTRAGNTEIRDNFKKELLRADDAQEATYSVTLDPQPGELHSTLFESCLANSRPFEVTFESVDSDGGVTFVRKVLDSDMLGYTVPWEDAVGTVLDIFQCADAAEQGNYDMFKFSGESCKLSTMAYDLNTRSECRGEEEASAVVFISTTSSSLCKIPYYELRMPVTEPLCVGIITTLMTYEEAYNFRGEYKMLLYSPSSIASLAFVRPLVMELGFTQNFWVENEVTSMGSWSSWYPPEEYADGSAEPGEFEATYMSFQNDYKLTGASLSELAGAILIRQV